MVHLFVVYGYQGAEEDAEKLRLTDRLLQAVLAEAQVVCVGQPMLIAGDLNADPAVIPCLAKGMSAGRYVDLALAHSFGAGVRPDNTCAFNRDDGSGSRRDFFVGCPNALAASQACCVTDRWFTPHFSILARFRIDAWMVDVSCPIACQPLWPACWLDTPDRSSSSSSRIVQDVWDVYRDVLGVVPDEVVGALRDAASRSAVDDFWSIWSQNAEAGLFRAYELAGGPTAAGRSAFLGRGLLRIRNRRLGGRAAAGSGSSRLYRVSQGDDVDVHCAQYFVHSSLSPVLLFRRRLKSVADVLKGIKGKGFTQSRWDALLLRWCAVCRYGPCGPISSLHPWENWIPPDLHGFYRWVFDSLEVLNGFVRQVVISRRDEGIRRWNRWLREDLSSRPYAWLRPDFVPPAPFLVIRILLPILLGSLLNLILLMLSFVRPGCLIFVGLVILRFLLISFSVLLVIFCLNRVAWIYLVLLVVTCKRLLVRKSLLLVVWMVGLGMRLRLFPCLGFLGLLFSWNLLSLLALGLRVFWMHILP